MKTTQKICDLSQINPRNLWDLFQVTERLITDQTEITGLTTIDWQQPMWNATTKHTSFLWEVWVLSQSKHGKARLNGFRNTLSQRFWCNRLRTNGIIVDFSQDSPNWRSLTRFRRWWLNQKCVRTAIQRKDNLYVHVQSHWLEKRGN